MSEWADTRRRLSPEVAAEPGQWYTTRAEYLRGVMDAFSDPRVHTVVMMTSAQVGKTSVLENVLGYHIDQDPAPILLVQPTLEMAEGFSKERLAPMFRDTVCLAEKVGDPKTRDGGNTLRHKVFPGGYVALAGANSPASLAGRPIRIAMLDETDRFPATAGVEGDPASLARKRSTTFWNRKLGLFSTPTVKGASRIEVAFEAGDQRRYFVPCPHCAHAQILTWKQVQWDEGDSATALYYCEHCGAGWNDGERRGAVRLGQWVAGAPFRGTASFHLNELYSGWVRLADTVQNFLEAKKYPDQLRVWVNTALGESWEDEGEKLDATGLMARREAFPTVSGKRVVPAGAAVLTAGVDVQDDRIELEVIGWGAGEENWSLEYHVLHGDPSTEELWQELDEVLSEPRRHELGIDTFIRAAAIDTGGHHTQPSYRFCRPRFRRTTPDGGRQYVFAIKGTAGRRPIWPDKSSKKNIGKVNLYSVGVDTAKEVVTDRLRIEVSGPGFAHFPLERGESYFEQLTAEQVVTRFVKGFPKREWVKRKPRNEAFDCRVYGQIALTGLISVSRLRIEKELEELRAATTTTRPPSNPEPPDEGPGAPPAPAAPRAPSSRPQGGWLRGRGRGWMG